MITLREIYDALTDKRYADLRALWDGSAVGDIEKCDLSKKSVLRTGMIRAVVFRGTTEAEDRMLFALLSAIERGLHPHDDPVTMEIIQANTHLQ